MAAQRTGDIMSRTKIGDMKNMAAAMNLTLPTNQSREVLGAFVYLAEKGLVLQDRDGRQYDFVKPTERNWHRLPLPVVKQCIHERIQGTTCNPELVNEFLELLKVINQRDVLVCLLLILDKEGVFCRDWTKNAGTDGQPLTDEYIHDCVLNMMIDVAIKGLKPDVFSEHEFLRRPPQDNTAQFHRFSRLPRDIRCHFWQIFAFMDERVIKLHTYKNMVKTTCPPPTVLHVCHESRRFTKFLYEKIFANNAEFIQVTNTNTGDQEFVNNPNYIFVNLELDTIAFGHRLKFMNGNDQNGVGVLPAILPLLPDFVRNEATKIALSRDAFKYNAVAPHNFTRIIEFTAMEELTWFEDEVIRFAAHHVIFTERNDGAPLAGITTTELTAAYLADNRVIDPKFRVRLVTERRYCAD